MYRRALLATAGVGTATLLSGCISGDGNGGGNGDGNDGENGDGNDGGEPLDGQWEISAVVKNEDDEPRGWRVECRSEDRGSVAAAYSTLPAGEETELGLMGQLRDEEQEVYVESDNGSVGRPWRPTECRHLSVEVAITNGEPIGGEECLEE